MLARVKNFTEEIIYNVYTRSDGPLAEADAWGDDENEYYNDRPDARPPSPPVSKAPLAEYATPPSNLPVSYMSHSIITSVLLLVKKWVLISINFELMSI